MVKQNRLIQPTFQLLSVATCVGLLMSTTTKRFTVSPLLTKEGKKWTLVQKS
jgi:hypothetical protein